MTPAKKPERNEKPEHNEGQPLAARLRPKTLDQFFGQTHLLAPGKPLRAVLDQGHCHSMIFWGPPGSGKTTLARMIATHCDAQFIALSAVMAGVKEIRAAMEAAKISRAETGQRTIVFIDEVHRFNKAQQDAFLPFVEEGDIIFIGATTENPSFEVNNALLSRARVYVLQGLTSESLLSIIDHALAHDSYLATSHLTLDAKTREALVFSADGDARRLLNLLEILADMIGALTSDGVVTPAILDAVLSDTPRQFDKHGENFYDQISALHKSLRGSAPDPALYWFMRMLDGGCDPLYVARRLVRFASEDIGNADPRALEITLNACAVFERLGSPEGELALAQAVLYLAVAPKSNASYLAFKRAQAAVKEFGSKPVPLHIRNAPTKLMKSLNYGKDYRYAHNENDAYAAGENYWPEGMPAQTFYEPVARGLEIKIREKLSTLKTRDEQYTQNLKVKSTSE